VLQDAPPHRRHRDHARIYRTTGELLHVLEELFNDRAQLEAVAQRGREWMERERSPAALAAERDRFYRSLLGGRPRRAAIPRAPEASGLGARLARARRAAPEQALDLARELAAEHPAYDQAHLMVARCLERLGRNEEALAYAEGVEPSPVYADLFAELKARVAPQQAARHTAQLRSPFRRARLATAGSAEERSQAVLQHNPYDWFALASTIRRLERDDPDSAALELLYERAAMLSPETLPATRRPERLAPFLPA
jgi:hypothetical protein